MPSPDLRRLSLRLLSHVGHFRACALAGRLLFSCLVDADYVETERFYAAVEGWKLDRSGFPSLAVLASALDQYLSELTRTVFDSPVNRLRAEDPTGGEAP
jgi:CRISPR-associated endonuclease/helicase Cas3